jgi:ribosomal protein S18 acetylase RimI-like enzyme
MRIRDFEPSRDLRAVELLDNSFESRFHYVARHRGEGLCLEREMAEHVYSKRFPVDLRSDPWDRAFVAVEENVVRGFIATSFASWNRRLIIWHFYVDASHRGRGIGRELMNHVIEIGREIQALVVWLETSNRNDPGVQAYRRLGFAFAGFDTTLYTGTPAEGEFALFLSRRLADNVGPT